MSTKIRVSENSLEIKLEGEDLNLSLPPFPIFLQFLNFVRDCGTELLS